MSNPVIWLSLIVFLPALSCLALPFLPKDKPDTARMFMLAVSGAVLVLTFVAFLLPNSQSYFDPAVASMQSAFTLPWIPSFSIDYAMGLDGISFPLIMLTALVSFLAAGASWSITRHVKAYCALFLILETGMLGVFVSLDFFLFYIFWEVMLLPMYFLIGVWGGPRREYAAIKFFLYTLLGGVLMLIALLMLYFSSDLRTLAEREVAPGGRDIRWSELHINPVVEQKIGRATLAVGDQQVVLLRQVTNAERPLEVRLLRPRSKAEDVTETLASYDATANRVTVVVAAGQSSLGDVVRALATSESLAGVLTAALASGSDGNVAVREDASLRIAPLDASLMTNGDSSQRKKIHTFNMLALAAMGQHTTVFDTVLLGHSIQWWSFILLFIGFIIKVPSVPLHTWLPDAHVEAPTPISMILAGVLLKMGGYGIIRICYPICPQGGYQLAYFVCLIGVISMVYGAYAALAQKDFKRMVAYSSVSHMGYVVLGLGVWSSAVVYNSDYWNMGIKGAMFQMIAHGISSAGMFFMVGVLYDRVHHRNLNEFGGIFGKMPVYTALSIGIFFAGLGLPGLCGFIGEVFVTLSVWNFNKLMAVIAAFVVILTASYILWAIQRVYLGAEYKGPHEEALVPATYRENSIAGALFVLAILLGVFPHFFVLRYMDSTIDQQVRDLAAWTQDVGDGGAANIAGGSFEAGPPAMAAAEHGKLESTASIP